MQPNAPIAVALNHVDISAELALSDKNSLLVFSG